MTHTGLQYLRVYHNLNISSNSGDSKGESLITSNPEQFWDAELHHIAVQRFILLKVTSKTHRYRCFHLLKGNILLKGYACSLCLFVCGRDMWLSVLIDIVPNNN